MLVKKISAPSRIESDIPPASYMTEKSCSGCGGEE